MNLIGLVVSAGGYTVPFLVVSQHSVEERQYSICNDVNLDEFV